MGSHIDAEARHYFWYDGYGPEKLAYRDGYNIPRVYSVDSSGAGGWRREYDHEFGWKATPLTEEEFERELEATGAPAPTEPECTVPQ